jgi:AcrR family transcriptional regulator
MCSVSTVPKTKRDQLLEAAWAVIAERGVHGLRVEDAAEAVGVANATVYYHFESRAGLLAATMDYNDASALSSPARNSSGSGLERVTATLVGDLGDSKRVRDNDIVWNDLNAAAVFDSDLRTRVAQMNRNWVSEVAEMIRNGVQDGSVRHDVDPVAAAETLTALLGGLITTYLIGAIPRTRARTVLKDAIGVHLVPKG